MGHRPSDSSPHKTEKKMQIATGKKEDYVKDGGGERSYTARSWERQGRISLDLRLLASKNSRRSSCYFNTTSICYFVKVTLENHDTPSVVFEDLRETFY